MKFGKVLILMVLAAVTAQAQEAEQTTVRIKDIAYIEGVRENQLLGFGLVTGLDGKGDSSESVLLKKTLKNLINSFSISIEENDVRSRNCAAVIVTADIPPFVRPGDRISVGVSSVGDAKSLEGGILLQTNLQAGNGTVYAVAQGMLTTSTRRDAVKTVATVQDGAIVEREVLSTFFENNSVSLVLYNPDFSTASSVASAVAETFPEAEVNPVDASLITVSLPQEYEDNPVGFISRLERLEINPDFAAKVVINPRSGVVVFGKDVKIGRVAVSYKEDNIQVGTPFGGNEKKEQFMIEDDTTVEDLITVLQEVGLKTDVIIEILKAIEKTGALFGKLVIM